MGTDTETDNSAPLRGSRFPNPSGTLLVERSWWNAPGGAQKHAVGAKRLGGFPPH